MCVSLQDIRKHLKNVRPEMETLVVPDPFERNEYYHSDPSTDLGPGNPSTDLDPSGEVDVVEIVNLGGGSEGQDQNIDISAPQGQGQSNEVTSEWTTLPNNVPVDADLEDDLEDEGLELFEDDDFRSVDQDGTYDIDDENDEELIRGMSIFHFKIGFTTASHNQSILGLRSIPSNPI